MEVRIGIVHTGKELTLEVDGTAADLIGQIEAAIKDGAAIVWITDSKGKRVGAWTDKIAYVEIDENGSNRHVGFGR